VDFHAEATSEKRALGWYLDGRVTVVVGTHTHVQTADEDILPGGTAYLTDAGMTGSFDSVIGMNKEQAMQKFVTQMPVKFDVAKRDVRLCGLLVEADEVSGKALQALRIAERCE
jgi:calcineurin-like phosphoesterase